MSKIKSCDICTWEIICKKDKTEICDEFAYECDRCSSEATLYKDNEVLCADCALKETEIEEMSFTEYFLDGECIGNENDDIEYIIHEHFKEYKLIEEE